MNNQLSKNVVLFTQACVVLLDPMIGFATNFYFLPGDSCFHTTLTKTEIARLQESVDPTFRYVRPESARKTFSGNAGFFNLQYKSMPEEFKENLMKTYETIRETRPIRLRIYPEMYWDNDKQADIKTGKMIQEETNPIHVFLVNKDFDLERFKIGLKYNENWVTERQAIVKGMKLKNFELDRFVDSPLAVVEEWRDAKTVRPLDVACPELSIRNSRKPVQVSKKIKAIVLPTGDMESYFKNRSTFYVVDEAGIKPYKRNEITEYIPRIDPPKKN